MQVVEDTAYWCWCVGVLGSTWAGKFYFFKCCGFPPYISIYGFTNQAFEHDRCLGRWLQQVLWWYGNPSWGLGGICSQWKGRWIYPWPDPLVGWNNSCRTKMPRSFAENMPWSPRRKPRLRVLLRHRSQRHRMPWSWVHSWPALPYNFDLTFDGSYNSDFCFLANWSRGCLVRDL